MLLLPGTYSSTASSIEMSTTLPRFQAFAFQQAVLCCGMRGPFQRQEESYTWPGSNWRPSACEADVIATRPQVLLPLVALALRCGNQHAGQLPQFFSTSPFCLGDKLGHRLRASCLMLPHPPIRCQQLCIMYATTRRLASRACGVVVSHPLRMRKALGSIPSRSNCPNHSSLLTSNVTWCCASRWH